MKVRDLFVVFDYKYDNTQVDFEIYHLNDEYEFEYVDGPVSDPVEVHQVFDKHVYKFGVDINKKVLYIVYDDTL